MMDEFSKPSKKGSILAVACYVFAVALLITAFVSLAACHQNISFTFLLFFFPFLTPAIFLLCRQQALFHLHRVCFNVPAQLGGVAKLPKLLGEGAELRGVRLVAVEFLALL